MFVNSAERLVVVGAGGHGREMLAYVKDLIAGEWAGELLGFLDDGAAKGQYCDMQVLGKLDEFATCGPGFFERLVYLTAVGDNPVRRTVVERIQALYGDRMKPWTLVHPRAYIGNYVEVGAGTCVAPGAIVTCRSRIGRHCILNVKASVSHDCVIGDYVNLNPSVTVCGNVTLGDGAYIGAGATIVQRISVGRGSIIGAGAVVIRDIPPNVTAVGVPARVVKEHSQLF